MTWNVDGAKEQVLVQVWCCCRRSKRPCSEGTVRTSRPRCSCAWPPPSLKTKKSNICTDFGCTDTLTVFIRDQIKGRHHRRDPLSRGRAPDRWRLRPDPRWPPASSSGRPTSTGTLGKQEARQGQRLSSWRRHCCHEVNEILPPII